jgi:hypothetical protein
MEEEKKQDFKPATVKNLINNLRNEEKLALEQEKEATSGAAGMEDNSKPTASSTYPPSTTLRPLGGVGG